MSTSNKIYASEKLNVWYELLNLGNENISIDFQNDNIAILSRDTLTLKISIDGGKSWIEDSASKNSMIIRIDPEGTVFVLTTEQVLKIKNGKTEQIKVPNIGKVNNFRVTNNLIICY